MISREVLRREKISQKEVEKLFSSHRFGESEGFFLLDSAPGKGEAHNPQLFPILGGNNLMCSPCQNSSRAAS